jgi:hypothetical protein
VLPRFAAATAVVMVAMWLIDQPLRTAAAPHGIVSFELAGDVATAQLMLDSWDTRARAAAGLSLGLDYLFLVLYSTTLALACRRIAGRFAARGSALAGIGFALAWGQWIAAACDGVENFALIRMLLDGARAPWPTVAWWFASVKFGLLGLGFAYLLNGLVTTRAADVT